MSAVTPPAVADAIRGLAAEIFVPDDLTSPILAPALKARAAGFIVLAHAEIEWAIERACLSIAGLLRGSTDPATSLLVWGFFKLKSESDGSKRLPKKGIPLHHLVSVYETTVTDNHGIKEENIRSLLVPIGVDVDSLNADIAVLDAFGARRGQLAHRAVAQWNTTDLPSVHVNSAIQAGQAADQVVAAITTKHSVLRSAPKRYGVIFRRRLALFLKNCADAIEKR